MTRRSQQMPVPADESVTEPAGEATVQKRVNVLWLAAMLTVIAVTALLYAWFNAAGDTTGAMAVVGAAAAALAMLAREIIISDARRFDPAEAAHLERMAALETEAEAKLAWHNLTSQAFRAIVDMSAERGDLKPGK